MDLIKMLPAVHTFAQNASRACLALAIATSLTLGLDVAVASAQGAPAKTTKASATQNAKNKLVIQVDEKTPEVMNLALNNAENVIEYFKSKNETVDVHIVTFGPGLHMLRTDTSPVKARVAEMSLAHPNLHFAACENTRARMSKAENKEIAIMAEGVSVPSGVVTLMELQAKGYAYVRP
jgi:uncharacterized protein